MNHAGPKHAQPDAALAVPAQAVPRFVTGSLMRHVAVMAGTGAVGLVAVFAVDLVNLLYLSLLNHPAITAAVGFAGAVGYFQISICIGLTIGIGAIVSRQIGAENREQAGKTATAGLVAMTLIAAVLALATALGAGPIVGLLGATGETRALATLVLRLGAPAVPMLAFGMGSSALLRSLGDARRAMNVTLYAAIATAICDPILIFGLHLGLIGAVISTLISRAVMAWLGWHGVLRVHALWARVGSFAWWPSLRPVAPIALSAVLTNLATPVAAGVVTAGIARFGALAVAGQTTVDRITPVAFGLIFALSGAVGPIIAQNFGAHRPERVRGTLRASVIFMLITVSAAWLVLALTQNLLVALFHAEGDAAMLLRFFCTYLAGGYIFIGFLFVANASFNNLGHPLLATFFNWGRATLGTIPLVHFGMRYGVRGVISAQTLGSIVFGTAALLVAFHLAGRAPPGSAAR